MNMWSTSASSHDANTSKVSAPNKHWMFASQQKSEEDQSIETHPQPLMDTRRTLVSVHAGNSSKGSGPKRHWLFKSQQMNGEHKAIETWPDSFVDVQSTMASSNDEISSKDSTPRDMPVKNTFIHFDEQSSCDTRWWQTAPAVMLQGFFHSKVSPMEEAHSKGTCRPCFYHHFKPDGCRMGNDCEFCHICSREDVQEKKKKKNSKLVHVICNPSAWTNFGLNWYWQKTWNVSCQLFLHAWYDHTTPISLHVQCYTQIVLAQLKFVACIVFVKFANMKWLVS